MIFNGMEIESVLSGGKPLFNAIDIAIALEFVRPYSAVEDNLPNAGKYIDVEDCMILAVFSEYENITDFYNWAKGFKEHNVVDMKGDVL